MQSAIIQSEPDTAPESERQSMQSAEYTPDRADLDVHTIQDAITRQAADARGTA